MVIIELKNGRDWYKANWVFRQFAEDVMEAFPDDLQLTEALLGAQAVGLLRLNAGDEPLGSRIANALRKVAEDTVVGKVRGWRAERPDDLEGHRMYLSSIEELLTLLCEDNYKCRKN